MYQREDGIVDFDKSICIGCKACMAACPYDAIFINPDDHSAEKCNFCAHRLEVGLEPACVTVCPVEAILVGNLSDPNDKVTHIVNRETVSTRRPEKSTRPKLFYKGAGQATLDPLAANAPKGDTFMWSQMASGPGLINSGYPFEDSNHAATAKLSYDVSHTAPWGWRVSAYTWTKAIGTGTMLATLLFIYLGGISAFNKTAALYLPVAALAGLVLTSILLVTDLKHPERVMLLFLHPRFESWLVKGGFLLAIDGVATVIWSVAASARAPAPLIHIVGILLALAAGMTAIYTSFLFAQAKARDLWQSPLRAVHLFDQAMMVGFAVVSIFAGNLHQALVGGSIASALHIILVGLESWVGHPTEHAHVAIRHMIRGRYALAFWLGIATAGVGVLAPAIGSWALVVSAVGLLGYEHAYIQAGQAVPLA